MPEACRFWRVRSGGEPHLQGGNERALQLGLFADERSHPEEEPD